MSLVRHNSQQSFKPIPEDAVTHHTKPRLSPDAPPSKAPLGPSTTPEATLQELRKILKDLSAGSDGGGGGRAGGWGPGGSLPGSRPPSRSGLRSSSSRPGSRPLSRRSSWLAAMDDQEEQEEEDVQVTSSQKAHLLVASQQRLVYTLQGLRHQLSSLDEEVNRIRNDILNSRRFYNAMRGIQEQPTWGSCWRKSQYRSESSSPSMYSLDNSYSDEADSMARNESFSSFASWRSEPELVSAFRDAEEAGVSDRGSSSRSGRASATNHSDTSTSNDNGSNSSTGSMGHRRTPSLGNKDGGSALRGRYRQLGTPAGGMARR